MWMSVIDLVKRLREEGEKSFGGIDFELHRIALTEADTLDLGHDLSYDVTKKREGKKKGDPRLPWFRKNYGDRGWELDAMDPNLLRARVGLEIEKYIEREAWERCQLIGEAERQSVVKVAEQMAAVNGHDLF